MVFKIIRYKQNNQEYISTVIPFEYVDRNSKVLVYDEDEDGYQRKPNKVHYSKIKKYIIENIENFKLPTSIILGIDKDVVLKMISSDNCGEYLSLDNDSKDEVFRVVDGQHRLSGLREAAKIKSEINDILLNIIILITEENKKSIELEIFNDINSTAKRISTDLSTLAKFKYKIKEENLKFSEINDFIAINTAFNLKELKQNTVWTSGIKFDIHAENTLGIVGVTAFIESIKPIVSQLLEKKYKTNSSENLNGTELIKYCKEVSFNIAHEINEIWYEIIAKKWKTCFEKQFLKDEFGEILEIYYSENYYIQKTIGVKVINILYSEILKELDEENINDSIEIFENLIDNCKYNYTFWKKGGILSGLSSESGFSKARSMIKNGGSNSNQGELF